MSPPKKEQDSPLRGIKQKPLDRAASLLGITLKGGTDLAKMKLKTLFQSAEKRSEERQQFFLRGSELLVKELGKLKGSAMKAGQMLAVYGEHFFPPQVNQVLKSLHSQSEPVAWAEMEQVLHRQLGERYAELDLDPHPIGAASIGQVHRGWHRPSGRLVAVKIQYPGVDQAVDSDLNALKHLLAITQLLPKNDGFDAVFQEIRMMLHYETDFRREVEQLAFYRAQLKDDPRYALPETFGDLCTRRVIVMTLMEGHPIDSDTVAALPQARRDLLAASFLDLMYREMFQLRRVQTDPHFGNYRIQIAPGGGPDRVVLLDFGAVRSFPKRYMLPFAEMISGTVYGDPGRTEQAARQLGFLRSDDSPSVVSLFLRICDTAAEAFAPEHDSGLHGETGRGYDWAETDLADRLRGLACDAVFTFKLRPPPREAVFLDRKMVGMFAILRALRCYYGPRSLMLRVLDPFMAEHRSPR